MCFGGFRRPPKNEFCAAHQQSPPAQGSTPAQFEQLSWLKIEYRGSLTTVYARHIMKIHEMSWLHSVWCRLQLTEDTTSLYEKKLAQKRDWGPPNGSTIFPWLLRFLRSYTRQLRSLFVRLITFMIDTWRVLVGWYFLLLRPSVSHDFSMVYLSGGIHESPGHEF